MNRKNLLAGTIGGLILLFIPLQDSLGQIQTGVWRTPANNTDYHHFVRNGVGAAVYINQVNPSQPILRLSSGTATANVGVKFTVENDGRVGIGTTAPLSPLDVRTTGQSGLIASFLSDQGMPSSGEHRWILRLGRSHEYPDRTIDMGMVSTNYGTNPAFYISANGDERFRVTHTGNVGIGTTVPTHKLEVNGTIRAKEVKLEAAVWPDYVFEEGYELMSLEAVDSFIGENGHLPGLKPARVYEEEGVNMMELNQKLLEKVEELTIYAIQQEEKLKRLEKLEKEMETLKLMIKEKL